MPLCCWLRRTRSLLRSRRLTTCVRRGAIATTWRGIYSRNFWKFWQAERGMQNSSDTSRSSPATADLIVRGKRVVTPDGERAAAIHVRSGAIAAISGFDEIVQGAPVHE